MPQILTECGYYMPGTVLHTTRNVDVTNLGPICKGLRLYLLIEIYSVPLSLSYLIHDRLPKKYTLRLVKGKEY